MFSSFSESAEVSRMRRRISGVYQKTGSTEEEEEEKEEKWPDSLTQGTIRLSVCSDHALQTGTAFGENKPIANKVSQPVCLIWHCIWCEMTFRLQLKDLSIVDHLFVRLVPGGEEVRVLIKRLTHQPTEPLEQVKQLFHVLLRILREKGSVRGAGEAKV
ncbi:hypothetical protein E2C01_057067 [Portunus trituberculatus]|uniref:Uncharacterized protein n=1 Tax=Portunus trituberculatus TaxID=210409 RepID=A0A5B7GZC9_PORTR|nr:hypothetical protein [Portunus trituberculatus]